MSVHSRLKKLEVIFGKGEFEILTHEGFIDGTLATKRVSEQEYIEH